ncbi:LysR family transcriptional regulator [Limnohabitans sp. Rim8]|uniref:LysR family transcriptional regulator n=1 Tax=Limnohabitans sp. Rim8 TaxID=1100718 RepID=UPI000D3DC258|nr:LysR family transcriptional regulator [Limnohabitans sp. Rim8]PUE62127.1 LysR family transcriptional regulator [Limnohabitans sp. Rim8]
MSNLPNPIRNAKLENPFEDLTSLRIFSQAVELGSFSEVSRRMDVTPAMVSKRVATLEARLGQKLLIRNTRRLMVTEAGQLLYDHCARALLALDQASADISNLRDEPTGHLRITAPLMLGAARIAPRLPDFLKQYPQLTIDLNLSVDKIDLYQNRIDVAVRIADAVDPGMVAIKLAPYRRVFCASPEYLARHGTPQSPEDLANHSCLISRGVTLNSCWPMKRGDSIEEVAVQGRLVCDSGGVLRLATLAGLGIAMTSKLIVEDDLRDGTLVQVLSEFVPQHRAIYAVLLQRTDSSRKLAAAVEFLKGCFAGID